MQLFALDPSPDMSIHYEQFFFRKLCQFLRLLFSPERPAQSHPVLFVFQILNPCFLNSLGDLKETGVRLWQKDLIDDRERIMLDVCGV